MSLKAKILLILMVFFMLFAFTAYGINRFFILPKFVSIEEEEASKSLKRCFSAIEREIWSLDLFVNDWAAWDDTCNFMQGIKKSEYIKTNLGKQTFIDNKINLMLFLKPDGTEYWGELRDWKNGAELSPFGIDCISKLSISKADIKKAGIIKSGGRIFLISCRPIISSDRTGSEHGTLIMGRIMDEQSVAQIAKQTSTDLRIDIYDSNSLKKDHLTNDESYLTVSGIYNDITGNPGLTVKIRHYRSIATKGNQITRSSFLITMTAGLILSIILLSLIGTTIIRPIKKLTHYTSNVEKTGKTIPFPITRTKGEIGQLYDSFSAMMEQLYSINRELEERVESRTKRLEDLNNELKFEVARRIETEGQLRLAKQNLETRIHERTRELATANQKLTDEISERRKTEESLKIYHEKLISLASEITIAEERERRKIATGLHDCIGQLLTVAKLKLDTITVSTKDEIASELVSNVSSMLEQAITDTRDFTFRLSPPVLHELGLYPAMEWLAEKAEKEYGFTVRLCHAGKEHKPMDFHNILFFQAAKELLFNAFKHAEASIVEIGLGEKEGVFSLHVKDNGKGFDYQKVMGQQSVKGFGLFSISERISYIGGSMKVESSEGRGCCVSISIPASSWHDSSNQNFNRVQS